MRIGKCTPDAEFSDDLANCGWHRLILDTQGRVTSASGNIEQLLGMQIYALVGKCVTTILPDIPFSEMTPGYNLAYAVFIGARNICRNARCANGEAINVDTVLSNNTDGHAPGITLALRANTT
jgi:hypothetical protein